ncbi:plexin domain-containing protein 2 [Chelonus insularis]|uniref:plexin domain-containing protein 2 n=1 Tax=Chelonus insularis TaxID=460826 RepID=UPI00158A692D|nr:plexin domain-containing protein 2 [Chelonus insularis]
MACERCFLVRGCFIGFTLAFIFGLSTTATESDGFYHSYEVLSGTENDDLHIFYTDELDGAEFSNRVRRSLEPAPTTSPPQPSTHQPQDSTPESPLIKTETGATANVMYSTVNATNSTSESTLISTTLKPNVTKNGKTLIIVSPPLSPVTGEPVHVWPNQTRWENATHTTNSTQKTPDTKPRLEMNNSTEIPSNTTDFDESIFAKFSNFSNSTLRQNNISKTEEDTHQYYNSTFIVDQNVAKSFWVDMNKNPYAKINDLLSKSYRRAATVKLKFDFPFYGHKVRNITIATGGFLYTGEYVHSWLAATQYIAPLMANFDPRLSPDSFVKYADNGTAFTVEWTKVLLQDKPKAGAFTFQATLYDNGNIVFVYVDMPLPIEAIEEKDHPVKVGLSDAYIMDRTRFFVRKKTIYEYHRVHFNRQNIINSTVIYLRALPTCLQMENCTDCLTKVPEFSCKWCPEMNQCSNGTFRFRQDWLEKGCEQRNIREESSCPANPKLSEHGDNISDTHINSEDLSAGVQRKHLINELNISESAHSHVNMSHMSVSGIIGILLVISLVGGLVGWAAYAYRNPHSASGQMLIRYRPSQWSWRRGEARYTAATIHM